MHVQELKLSKRLTDLLLAADLVTVEQVEAAGREGLIAVEGIGPASADDILAAVVRVRAEPNTEIAPAPAPPVNEPVQPAQAAANARVTVRNASDAPVLLGGRYMFPGDIRTIRRHQIKPGLVVLNSGA